MAITRTQIAKQLLEQGGRVGLQGGGADMGRDRGPETGRGPGPVGGGDAGSGVNRDNRRGGQYSSPEGIAVNRQIDRDRRNEEFRKTLIETISPSTKRSNKFARIGLNIFAPGLGELFARAVDRSPTYLMSKDRNDLMPEDDNDSQFILPQTMFAQAPSITEPEPEEEEPFQISRRFRAEGGIMNTDVVGGEMDFESARQMYGLGKLVKKVTRSVKKIAKSDLGKAAILAAGGYYLGGGNLFGLQRSTQLGKFSFGQLPGASFFSKTDPVKLAKGVADRQVFNAERMSAGTKGGGLGIGTLITGASALSGLLTAEQEDEAQKLVDNTGIDIEAARNSILAADRQDDFRARRFRAEGGSTEDKEPVAKKVMPLLDMDGQEKDYRETGGFVDMGRMEKADDVPARLSKNEFVFTADAVRNAGDGSVDKGAEVMYNMMKNLEAGGEVSEESQGLEGARKMFQTSQRLEEVL